MRSSSTAKPPGDSTPSSPPDGLLEIGFITKPHGVAGEVTVRPITNQASRFAPSSCFETPRGSLTVATARRHKDRWLLGFEGIADRLAAQELAGTPLWAEPLAAPDAPAASAGSAAPAQLWVHELIGATVIDQHGIERGAVIAVRANPASDLLELEDGHLLPVNFITSTSASEISVDTPDGLFDLEPKR